MKSVDVIVPVKNEEKNVSSLSRRLDKALSKTGLGYNIIFVVDKSTDNTEPKLKKLSKKYPIIIQNKIGVPGKGYSIIEGLRASTADYTAFIDGDLQYPPEVLPEMLSILDDEDTGVVVANRRTYKASFIRKLGSRLNRYLFGKILLGLDCDTQSGLKVFKREIFEHIDTELVGPWTFDIPLLHAASELGYEIKQADIEFVDRKNGSSHVSFIRTAFSIASCALKAKFKKREVYYHQKDRSVSRSGNSLSYRKRQYVTHNSLHHHKSAVYTLHRGQKLAIIGLLVLLGLAFAVLNPLHIGIAVVGVLSAIYFADVLFTLYLTLKSLHFPPEIISTKRELKSLDKKELPVYTVLCPLYKEDRVLSQFVKSISKLDWPKDKLDVILLLEEDDEETQKAASQMDLPKYMRVMVVPHSNPKTKPKACNYGLHHAKGEYVVVYDAEDKPDPLQLKKAYLAFQKASDDVSCIQAKLNYYNPRHNLLTTLFTAEYSLWFDIVLPGLQSINTTIPLGGTSNHFKKDILLKLHAWDPFNVTEDCDLGARLFKDGYKTAIIDSTTWEEANSNVKSWVKQRSRWIKGYLQTYLVHMRNPMEFVREHRWHALIFQLIIGLRISFILINPILWLTTISYFTLYSYVGPTIESLYPSVVFYMAGFSLIFGNFLYLYNYMIGLAKKEHWGVIKYVFFVPFYWILMSFGAVVAFYQLIFKPHYWEKTRHGLHLKKKKGLTHLKDRIKSALPVPGISVPAFSKHLIPEGGFSPAFWSGAILITSTLVANFANFVYNAYLGREVDLSQFGTVSLISTIFSVSAVFSSSLGKVVAYKVAYLSGKLNVLNKDFYISVRKFTLIISLLATFGWIVLIPDLAYFFNESDMTPFLLFTPYWMISFIGSVNSGFLSGAHRFGVLGAGLLVESISKVVMAVLAVETGYTNLVYAVIPASIFITFAFEAAAVRFIRSSPVREEVDNSFPSDFYLATVLTKISSVVFLSADVILAKHFLSPVDAGRYALLSLSGKIVYFMGNLFSQFIIPVISKEEGKKRDSVGVFYNLLAGSAFLSAGGFVAIGLFGFITVPILFGENTSSIIDFVPMYSLAMFIFSISSAFVSYHQVKKQYLFSVVPLAFAVIEVVLIALSVQDIMSFVGIIAALSGLQLAAIGLLHIFYDELKIFVEDFSGLSLDVGNIQAPSDSGKLNILVYNWRDTKHVWAGGAEIYVHELAKRWVAQGHNVTVFCGNDRKCKRNETVDGVNVIRRGGFYTVYLWAAFYYLFKLRKTFDVVVDSENGIPFFTPLFVRKPKVLLIHHVHKDIVLRGLKLPKYLLPVAFVAQSLESWLMPFLYRRSKVVAVSESTKSDLEKIGFREEISIVNPGVEPEKFKRIKKTKVPSILYLGRIKYYKSLDTLIKAHKLVVESFPDAVLNIAGFGEARAYLEDLADNLDLNGKVKFLGRVSEELKVKLMGRSWVFVHPSTMEGWGISVIEASASGTAIVASDVPGLRDSVRNPSSGYLVEQGNSEEFAKVIVHILSSSKERKRLEKEGVRWAKNFTWDKSAEKFVDVLSETAGLGDEFENN